MKLQKLQDCEIASFQKPSSRRLHLHTAFLKKEDKIRNMPKKTVGMNDDH